MIAAQVLDQGANLADLIGIEADGGFVEDDHVGFVDDRLRDPDALLIPLGERADQSAAHVVQAATAPGALHGLVERTFPHFVQASGQAQVFVDLEFPVQRRHLGQVTDARLCLSRLVEQVDAADAHLAASGREVAGQHLHGRGLARAVGAEQAQDFTAFELQGYFTYCAIAAVGAR